eukprot:5588869-Prymnesium_polylepis.2
MHTLAVRGRGGMPPRSGRAEHTLATPRPASYSYKKPARAASHPCKRVDVLFLVRLQRVCGGVGAAVVRDLAVARLGVTVAVGK